MPRIQKQCPICNQIAEEKSCTLLPAPINLIVHNLICGHSYTDKIEELKDWEKVETFDGFGKKVKLFPYQGEGYEFARESNFRCLIADEPGLGKTFQADVCLRLHPDLLTPTLIVCKSALKLQQYREIVRMCGPDFMPQIISTSTDRPYPEHFKVCIVTYDILWRIVKAQNKKRDEMEAAFRQELKLDEWDILPDEYDQKLPSVDNPFVGKFKFVILDECQQIKNPNSKRAQQVRDICRTVPHIIATSGSPIENNAGEYFTILNILHPERFNSYKDYIYNYCDAYQTAYGYKIGGIRDIAWFKERTKDFIIRRKMEDVQKDIPKLFRRFQSCEFPTDKLKKEYQELQEEFSKYFYENEGHEDFQKGILERMTIMRHMAGISKVPFAVEYIVDFINDTNKKIVIFLHHHDVHGTLNLRLVKEFEEMRKTGSTIKDPINYTADLNSVRRDQVVQDFVNDPDIRVFIGSLQASGEGLDGLQKVASDCIILERQWNPKKEEQAERRVRRIGSLGTGDNEAKIDAHYIMLVGTIDEYFTELVEQKRANVDQTLDGIESNWDEASLFKELAETLARKGAKKWRLK